MPRLDRHARLGRHQRGQLGKALFLKLDFKNAVYTFKGDPVAVANVFSGSGGFNAGEITAGVGMGINAQQWQFGSPYDAALTPGFTAVMTLTAPSNGASLDTMFIYFCDVGDTVYRMTLFGWAGGFFIRNRGNNSTANDVTILAPNTVQKGRNKVAFTMIENQGIAGALNGEAMGWSPNMPPYKGLTVGVIKNAASGVVVEDICFYRPTLDLDMLAALTRV